MYSMQTDWTLLCDGRCLAYFLLFSGVNIRSAFDCSLSLFSSAMMISPPRILFLISLMIRHSLLYVLYLPCGDTTK